MLRINFSRALAIDPAIIVLEQYICGLPVRVGLLELPGGIITRTLREAGSLQGDPGIWPWRIPLEQ